MKGENGNVNGIFDFYGCCGGYNAGTFDVRIGWSWVAPADSF